MRDWANSSNSNKGENHPNAKLTYKDVELIRVLSGRIAQSILANWFRVDQSQINRIVNRRAWN